MCVRTTGARIRHILVMAPVVRTLKPVVRTLPAMKGPSKSCCEDQKSDKARFENKNKFERTGKEEEICSGTRSEASQEFYTGTRSGLVNHCL